MISVREEVFETNSSSAHSLTIAHKSFVEKLKSEEIFYTGPFKYFSDTDETFWNELDEEKYITAEEFWQKLKTLPKDSPYFEKINSSKDLTELKQKLQEDSFYSWGDLEHDLGITNCQMMFGEHNYSDLLKDKEYDLANGDKLVLKLVEIEC